MKLFGIIGKPLHHSPSPKFYNAFFKKRGLPYRYLPFQVEEKHLKNLVLCMKLCDVAGLNVTTPFKEKVIPLLDGLDASARLCGAVNTIVRKKNRFIGYNTDGVGFLKAIQKRKKFDPKNKIIAMTGAGGAARGIAATLAKERAKEIYFFNRHLARAKKSVAFLRKNFPKTKWGAFSFSTKYFRAFFPSIHLLVQTIPASLKLPHHLLPKNAIVSDIRTTAPDGFQMFLNQARMNLKLWLGVGVHSKVV